MEVTMKNKIIFVLECISGIISIPLMILNLTFIFELIALYTSPTDDTSTQLSKGILLVLLIIFMGIMDAVALIRWIIYTRKSVIKRGVLKAILIQLPFLLLFAIIFAWLYSFATENIDLGGIVLSTLMGSLGFTFIFADIDLYRNIVKIFNTKKNRNNDNTDATDNS